jgi:hypothetical protein
MSDRVRIMRGFWNASLVDELLAFGSGGRNDDQVDALGLAARELLRHSGPIADPEPEKIPEQVVLIGGRRYLNQGLNELFEQAANDRPKGAAAMN